MHWYEFYTTAAQLAAVPPLQPEPLAMFYLGPDTVLPLASVLAAVIGVILMFGRRIFGLFVRRRGTDLPGDREVASSSVKDDSRN